MQVWHITLKSNLESILRTGIDPARSKGKRLVSWFTTKKGLVWAFAHCSARHGVPVSELVAIEVAANRKWLERTAWKGRWTCGSVIGHLHFQAFLTFATFEQQDRMHEEDKEARLEAIAAIE